MISTSWGQCEAQLPPAYLQAESSIFQQAVAQGQTVVAAAGDEGSEDCYCSRAPTTPASQVDDPASQPWVTGVGGTTINALGPPPTESVWNLGSVQRHRRGWDLDDVDHAGVATRPRCPEHLHQGRRTPSPGPSRARRARGRARCRAGRCPTWPPTAIPRTGLAIFCSCASGGWAKIGGTSMAAPLWGALVALADQGQSSPVGFVNPALYQARCGGSPRLQRRHRREQPARWARLPSNPPRTPAGPVLPSHPGLRHGHGARAPPSPTRSWADLRRRRPTRVPVVTGISASSGPAAGGTTVTVSGSNLSGVSEVDFGNGNPGRDQVGHVVIGHREHAGVPDAGLGHGRR